MQCDCNAAHYAADGGHLDVLCFLSGVGFRDFDQQSRVMQCCSLLSLILSFCLHVDVVLCM